LARKWQKRCVEIYIAINWEERGPISLEEANSLLAAGTVTLSSLARLSGQQDWIPLSGIPGIRIPTAAFPGEAPESSGFAPGARKISRLAIASFILGCCGWGLWVFTGIPAVICGHMARAKIKRSQGRLIGSGIAFGGLICGYLSIVGTLAL